MTTVERIWRIEIQIAAMQLTEWRSREEGREQWKRKIWETLLLINSLAQQFQPSSLPQDLAHCDVLNVDGGWLESLTSGLWEVFCGVPTADTLKIDKGE